MKTAASKTAGYSMLEFVTANTIVVALAAMALPNLLGFRQEAALLGAAQAFRMEFMKARSVAIMKSTQTAIRFETDPRGVTWYSTYIDGNFNGVLSADIAAGKDSRIAGPFRLDGGQSGVTVDVIPGAVAPDGGPLGQEPIRFGAARMVSFSPIGTGTPGTFYLRTRTSMAGVRVTGGSARVRIMLLRGSRWIDRQGESMRTRDTSPILKIVPRDQETGVPRDATVLVAAPRPVDQKSTSGVRVFAAEGDVEGTLAISSDGRILFWRPRAALSPEAPHRICVSGVRDERGALFNDASASFVTGLFSYEDLHVLAE